VKISFHVAILAVVIGLLVVTAGTLAVFGLVKEQQSFEVLKQAYLEQVADAAVREVSRLPRLAETVLRAHHALAERGLLPLHDPAALARMFAGVLQQTRDLAWLSYGDQRTGFFAGANWVGGRELVINLSDPRRDRGVPREFRVADPGELTPFVRDPPLTASYDPRTRPWYRRAVESPTAIVWMPPYRFAEGVTGITAALAVRAPRRGGLRGVLTADFALDGMDRFLRSLKVVHRGEVLLFATSGEYLAGTSSTGRALVEQARRTWDWEPDGGSAEIGWTVRSGGVAYGGVNYDVMVRRFHPGSRLDWAVAVFVPEDQIMGAVYANRQATIVISVVGLILAVAVGIVVSTGIARSLGGVAGELDRLARFAIRDTPLKDSVLKEIWSLQQAVGRVKASLRSFARYAPEEIVRDVVVSGREAMLSGEQREVTVLFGDLRGFTGLSEKTRPDEVVAMLNDHFDVLSSLVAKHDGFVVDFLGDSLFAVFGAPAAASDHAARAVACAIEMQVVRQARDAVNRARGWPPMEIGVGINTGPAIVGNMGSPRRIKYGVVGHTVNLAARIETFTVGGQVLVSQSTQSALGTRLLTGGPLEAEGKGVEGAIRMWDVRGLRGDVVLDLPSPVHDLIALPRPLPAHVRLIHGKRVGAQIHPAELVRLGATGAGLRPTVALTLFEAVQVFLRWEDGGSAALDGQVIAAPEAPGDDVVVVRFSGLDWDTRTRLTALARREAARLRAGAPAPAADPR
jgi:class 3 adenylate cyclase